MAIFSRKASSGHKVLLGNLDFCGLATYKFRGKLLEEILEFVNRQTCLPHHHSQGAKVKFRIIWNHHLCKRILMAKDHVAAAKLFTHCFPGIRGRSLIRY